MKHTQELLAKALFEAEHPERPWKAECAMLDGPEAPYSWVPEFRKRAATALAHLSRSGLLDERVTKER